MIEVLTPPRTVNLTTLARLKADLRIPDTDVDAARDEWLEDKIEEASRAISEELDRPLTRQRVRERFSGGGRTSLTLELTPVVWLESLAHDDTGAESLTDGRLRVINPDAGIVWREEGWEDDSPWQVGLTVDPLPQQGDMPWESRYWGGWLTADDDVLASGIDVVDGWYRLPTGVAAPYLVSGELVVARGFATPGNNGRFRVLAREADGVLVDAALTNEDGGPDTELRVRNAPSQLERLVFDTIRAWMYGRLRDPSISSERLGDWSASYGGGDTGADTSAALPPNVLRGLDRWRRWM